jgi:membrane protease subunit HflC
MLKSGFRSLGLAVVVILFLIVFQICTYTVSETEQVVLTRFGAPIGQPVTEAGLHFRLPFITTVNRIDKRILEWDGGASEMPTRDKLYIIVDTFGRWRISDPMTFFIRMQDVQNALSRINGILGSEVRNAAAKNDLIEIVRTDKTRKASLDPTLGEGTPEDPLPAITLGRTALEQEVVKEAAPKLKEFGIELLDIRFMRINYNDRVTSKIYDQMISERQKIASLYRSEGAGEAAKINGTRERELRQIESEAYRDIQKIRGEADAKAAAIYSEAYNSTPEAAEFYRFQRTMEAYPGMFDHNSTLVLSTDSDLLRFFKSPNPKPAIRAPETKPAPAAAVPPPAPAPATPAPAAAPANQ